MRYPVESFTDAERQRLQPHCSNLDGPVFALMNLPETVKGAAFARYSRHPGTLRRLMLDEFADDLHDPVASVASGSEGAGRATQLYERIFLGYGDDSVAQLGGAHVACEWVSNLLTKILQRPRLASYLEQSTRYIAYDAPMPAQRPGDRARYRYYTDPELGVEYEQAMDELFTIYSASIPVVTAGRHGSSRSPTATRRPRTSARSGPRPLTFCAACCPPRRCRTWASSRRARATSS